MRIFIFEHVCGGGMVRQVLDKALVQQAVAMLKAVADDFMSAGVQVLTTLDHRIDLALDGAQVLIATDEEPVDPVIDQLAAEADWALLIAPEFDRILETWSEKLTAAGARRLGSGPEAVAMCADKLGFARLMVDAAVPTPPTSRLDPRREIDQPMVVKRRRGAGCEEVYLCRTRDELAALPVARDWIVQPYVNGLPVSASLIVRRDKRRRLLVSRQLIEQNHRLTYHGGCMPVEAALADRAFALAEQAIGRVTGLHGFVGVDMILCDNPADDVVIEINARPTMSYVGLRHLCKTSVAMALIDPAAPLDWRDGPVQFDESGRIQTP